LKNDENDKNVTNIKKLLKTFLYIYEVNRHRSLLMAKPEVEMQPAPRLQQRAGGVVYAVKVKVPVLDYRA